MVDVVKFQAELFAILEAHLNELDIEVAKGPGDGAGQIGDTLLFLLHITEDGGSAMADLRFAGIDEERVYVQIYLTIFNDLEDGYAELEKALPVLNYFSTIGAYGMFPPGRQFWHKYSLVVREFDFFDGADGFAVALMDVLDLIREQNTAIYDTVAALASGAVTHQEAVQSGLLNTLMRSEDRK